MNRRKLREHLFKMVFVYAFTLERDMPEQLEMYLDGIEGLSEEDRGELLTRYEGVHDRIPEIDRRLGSTAKGWKVDRFAKADLAILRVAAYEAFYDDSVPEGVAINEAVELAKIYGGDGSPAFVNGILGELSKGEKHKTSGTGKKDPSASKEEEAEKTSENEPFIADPRGKAQE